LAARNARTVLGLPACLAVAARRPQTIDRLWHSRAVRRDVADLLRTLAAERKPYNEVDDAELERIAGSPRHGGVVLRAGWLPTFTAEQLGEQAAAWVANGERRLILVLDGVTNPHNIGALLRTAAHFGVTALLGAEGTARAAQTPSASRVACGGLEAVRLVDSPDVAASVAALRELGVEPVALDHRSPRSLAAWSPRGPVALVMGSEEHGVDAEVLRACATRLSIPGTGAVESLNVSVAAAIALAAAAR
jgi:TrmH RNA methyltransferase